MRAISSFSFEAGISIFCCFAWTALRTRARKSATGSVRLIVSPYSLRCPFVPASPGNPRQRTAKPFLVSRFRFLEKRETRNEEPHYLPGRLRDAGDLALEREPAEAQAADAELAQVRARASAELAAIVAAARELGFLSLGARRRVHALDLCVLDHLCCGCHCFLFFSLQTFMRCGMACPGASRASAP